jgi:hypothetical protein
MGSVVALNIDQVGADANRVVIAAQALGHDRSHASDEQGFRGGRFATDVEGFAALLTYVSLGRAGSGRSRAVKASVGVSPATHR